MMDPIVYLYRIEYNGETFYVEASSFTAALEIWGKQLGPSSASSPMNGNGIRRSSPWWRPRLGVFGR